MKSESSLIIRFKDQSKNYTYGFEGGIFYALCEIGTPVIQRTMHRENIELIRDTCEYFGYILNIKRYVDLPEWNDVIAIKQDINFN